MAAGLDHAAGDEPSAVVDAAGKRELARNAISAVRRTRAEGRIEAATGTSSPSAQTAFCAASANWLM
jgi:hypothetical protein